MAYISESEGDKFRRRVDESGNCEREVLGKCSCPEIATSKSKIKLPSSIMSEIFSRLPTKSITRFRCGCKLWDCLFQEPYFANLQLKNGPNKMNPGILTIYCVPMEGFSMDLYEEGRPLIHKFSMIGAEKEPSFTMSNSCNGLVCVFGWENTFLINPCTREFMELPKGSLHQGLYAREDPLGGLTFDFHTGEYRVVRLFHDGLGMACEVLTVGCPSWRRVDTRIQLMCTFPVHSSPAVVDDVFYWTIFYRRLYCPQAAVTYEMRNEKLGSILHPLGMVLDADARSIVGELAGHVCLTDVWRPLSQVDIWVLKDYSRREWVKQYSIKLLNAEDFEPFERRSVRILAIHGERFLFVHGKGGIFYYNQKDKSVYVVECPLFGASVLHAESLVSPGVNSVRMAADRPPLSLHRKLGLIWSQKRKNGCRSSSSLPRKSECCHEQARG